MNYSAVDPTFEVFPSTNLTANENTPMDTMMICVMIFSLVFGLPTHSYVIWLIITGTGNGVASELFMLNLSVCEMIHCLFALIYLHKEIRTTYQESVSLITLRILTGNIITIRPLFQCLMCVERYLAVVHPVTFLKYKPLRYRVILLFAHVNFRVRQHFHVVFTSPVPPLPLHPVVLSCGCSQSSEAVRTRREREREKGRKPHEEKSV